MTMLGNLLRKIPSAALALSLVPVIGIFPIHKILEICLPAFAMRVVRQSDVLRGIDGGTVTGQGFMLAPVMNVSPSSFHSIGGHLLVERLAFMLAVRNERHRQTEPFPFDFYSEGLAGVALMPVRQVT